MKIESVPSSVNRLHSQAAMLPSLREGLLISQRVVKVSARNSLSNLNCIENLELYGCKKNDGVAGNSYNFV